MSTSSLSLNDEFIFECDQHAVNIYEKFQKLYGEKALFDITLIAGVDCIKIPAHKFVLFALSEYFSEIFHGSGSPTMLRANDNEVELKEIDSSTLTSILDYMYSGSIELNLKNIEKLLRSAVFLKMEILVNGCCDYLEKNLNTSNCLYWLRLAKQLRLSELQEKSWKFIYNHFEEVTKESDFLDLNIVELKDLLFTDNPHEYLEEQVFLSLVAWLEYEEVNRKDLLLELLSMVRYQYLTPKFIVENSTLVNRTFESSNLILHWLKYHLSPESRTIEQQNLISSSDSGPRSDEVKLEEEILEVAAISFNNQNEAEIIRYNEKLETYSIGKRSRPNLIANFLHTMIVINKELFLVGGVDDNKNATNCFQCIDLKTFTFTGLASMNVGRYRSQLANLNGHLYVYGGFKEEKCKEFIPSMEVFNFSTRKWSYLEPLFRPDVRSRIVGHNGILYIINFHYGSIECYDVISNQWTLQEQPIVDNIQDFHMAAVGNFVHALCIGPTLTRFDSYFNALYKKLLFKCFDLSNNTWSDVVTKEYNTNSGDFSVQSVTLIGNKLLIHKSYGDIVEYNLDTSTLTELCNFNLYNGCILPLKI